MSGSPSLFDRPGLNPSVFRTFRLLHSLPLAAEFFAMRYIVDIYVMPHTAFSEYLVVHLPWQTPDQGRELTHAGAGVITRQLAEGIAIEVGTLMEVLFLRLARQGDAEELAGPHCCVPWKSLVPSPRGLRGRLDVAQHLEQ